jgi:hypothetical protein
VFNPRSRSGTRISWPVTKPRRDDKHTSMQTIRSVCVAVLFFLWASWAGATSSGTNHSDLWWNPSESGWGIQFVEEGRVIFATLFVYDANKNPTWYVATVGYVSGPPNTWTGTLYATAGPSFGGSFNPNAVTLQAVGSMTFVVTDVDNGTLLYSVNGLVVTKSITRQTLVFENFSGNFVGLVNEADSGCELPAIDGTYSAPVGIAITHNGSSFGMTTLASSGNSCSYSGTYTQSGHMGNVFGSFSCTDGTAGSFQGFEMEVSGGGFTSRFVAGSNRCAAITGRIGGVVQNP